MDDEQTGVNTEINIDNRSENFLIRSSLSYESIFRSFNLIKNISIIIFIIFLVIIAGTYQNYNTDYKIKKNYQKLVIKYYIDKFSRSFNNLFFNNNDIYDVYEEFEKKIELEKDINMNKKYINKKENKTNLNKIIRNLNSQNNFINNQKKEYIQLSNKLESNKNISEKNNFEQIKKNNFYNYFKTYDSLNQLKDLNITETIADLKFGEIYNFMNNITMYDYKGKWKGFNLLSSFENQEGIMTMDITKKQSQKIINLISNDEIFRKLDFTFKVLDGNYRDNWMIFNFTMKIPLNFSKNYLENNKNNNIIILYEDNVDIKYYIGELFEIKNETQCQKTKVRLAFEKDEIFKVDNFDSVNSIQFSKVSGRILDNYCNIDFDFNLYVELENVKIN